MKCKKKSWRGSKGRRQTCMTHGYRSWFQDLINVWTMPVTMLKNKVMYRQFIQCRFCKLKMYMFKTFVFLLSGHASYSFRKISHSKKNTTRYDQKMYIGLLVKYPLLLSDLNETWIFSTVFRTNSNIKFHANPSSGGRVVPWGQTDGQTDMMNLIAVFRDFTNAPKNWFSAVNPHHIIETNKIISINCCDFLKVHNFC